MTDRRAAGPPRPIRVRGPVAWHPGAGQLVGVRSYTVAPPTVVAV